MGRGRVNKTRLASRLGLARSTLYYTSKKRDSDESCKGLIEGVLISNPGYGHKRVAIELKINKKKILRIMKKFSLKPKIMRGRRPNKPNDIGQPVVRYCNLIEVLCPIMANVVWVGDFTYLKYHGAFVYLATIIDVYTREIIGMAIGRCHSQNLVRMALEDAIKMPPAIFHKLNLYRIPV